MRISSVEWFRNNADIFQWLQGTRILVSKPLHFTADFAALDFTSETMRLRTLALANM
jgi:hypothetical protein